MEDEDNGMGRNMVGSDCDSGRDDFSAVEGISRDFTRVLKRTEPVQAEDIVALSWYDSDLNLVIDENTFSSASPLHDGGFCFLQGGVRATHGFVSGCVCFEVQITSLCNIRFIDGHLNTHLIRVGWSPYSSPLALGSDRKSYGYDSNGKASNKGEMKEYGKSFHVGDVIGAYLDLSATSILISFTVNGEDQGFAYIIPRNEWSIEALFPHILSKNMAFECNFRSDCPWFTPKRGYTFVGDVPKMQRIRGPRAPKNQGDCELVMLIGLPRSGKTTWARELCARNPGKYYVLDGSTLVDRLELMDSYRRTMFQKKARVMRKILKIAVTRCRNYILDQVNVTQSEWQWKLYMFKMYQRRAVVITVPDDELERRIECKPLEKGPDKLGSLKAKFTLPKPSFLLNRVDYVGLSQIEAEELVKKYNEEASKQGYSSGKKKKGPGGAFQDNFSNTMGQLLAKGKNVNTVSKKKMSVKKNVSSLCSGIAFVSGGMFNESSIKPSGGEKTTANFNFRDDEDDDHSRSGESNPELDANQECCPRMTNTVDWPPGQKSTKRASSYSPPRIIAPGTGYPAEYGGRQDFHKRTNEQDCGPPRNERHRGWIPPNRDSGRDYSPSRGDGGGQRQFEEFAERGMRGGPGFPPRMLDSGGPRGGRMELEFQAQNKPASLSPDCRGSVPCNHPRGRASGQGDCYPPTRACTRGEEILDRDCAQGQRRASDISPHGTGRYCGEGYQRTEHRFGDEFASPERGGGFCEVPKTGDGHPLKERYREGRSEFPSHERMPGDNLSLQRDQRIGRGDRGEIPLQERRMSVEGLPSCQGRRDTCVYHENRMEGKTIQDRARTSTRDSSPMCRERMILSSGDRTRHDMYSNVPQDNYQGDWVSPSVSAVKELPLRNVRGDNPDEPGTRLRAYPPHEFHSAHKPRCGLGSHSPCSMSQEDSGYPERPDKWRGCEDGPGVSAVAERRGYPASRSPVGGPRVSPAPNRMLSPGASPGRDSRRSPFHEPRDLLIIRATRVSQGSETRNSPSRGLGRSPVPGGWAHAGSSDQFRREAREQYTRGSLSQLRRESPDDLQRESVIQLRGVPPSPGWRRQPSNEFEREFVNQLRGESVGLLRKGSPDHYRTGSPDHPGSGSPVHYRTGSPDNYGRESPDHPGRGFPDHFSRGSPDHSWRGYTDHHRRGSPDQQRRGSAERSWRGSPDRRRRGSPEHSWRGSPDHHRTGSIERRESVQFRRNSRAEFREDTSDQVWREPEDRFRSRSPDVREGAGSSRGRGLRGSRGRGRRGVPFAPHREILDQDSRRLGGSPSHRSRSPMRDGPSSSPSRMRRGVSNRGSGRSSVPWNDSPSGSRHHLTSNESRKRSYPPRGKWHSPRGKTRNKWHPGGVKRFKEKEMFDPSRTDRSGHFGEDDSESWSSGDVNDYEIIKQIFMEERSPGTLSVNLEDGEMSYDEALKLLKEDRPNFCGAARKRFRWLVQHGHSVKEARSLALQRIPKSEKQKGAPSKGFVKKSGK